MLNFKVLWGLIAPHTLIVEAFVQFTLDTGVADQTQTARGPPCHRQSGIRHLCRLLQRLTVSGQNLVLDLNG